MMSSPTKPLKRIAALLTFIIIGITSLQLLHAPAAEAAVCVPLLMNCSRTPTPSPTPSDSPSVSPTPSPSSIIPLPTPTPPPSATPTPSATPEPTASAAPVADTTTTDTKSLDTPLPTSTPEVLSDATVAVPVVDPLIALVQRFKSGSHYAAIGLSAGASRQLIGLAIAAMVVGLFLLIPPFLRRRFGAKSSKTDGKK